MPKYITSNGWNICTNGEKFRQEQERKLMKEKGPKLEEIFPSHELRKLTAPRSLEKVVDSPSKSTSSTSKSKIISKQIKTNNTMTKEKEKLKEAPKKIPQHPKAISQTTKMENTLYNINSEEFYAQLEQLKLSYPGSELLWLKGIATFFNTKLWFECDPIFAGKSLSYPSNKANPLLNKAILQFLESVGEENLAYFYHTLLNGMTMELSKNLPIIGYKFLLQLIGKKWPEICSNNMARTAMLCNSYINRSPIFLSILWAIGQGGYKSLTEGVKIWQNLMFPHFEMKNYNKFIMDYIENVLNSRSAENQSLNLSQVEFFTTFNALKTSYSGPPLDNDSCQIFLDKYISSLTDHSNLFRALFRVVHIPIKSSIERKGCISCLVRGNGCLKEWKMIYKKQVCQTIMLLKKIDTEWSRIGESLIDNDKLLDWINFLQFARAANKELYLENPNLEHSNLDKLDELVTSLQGKADAAASKKKSTEQKKKCGCCKWTLGSIFLIALIGGALCYDTQVNGKGVFAKSATGKVLQNAGLLPHVEKGWYTTMSASARGYKWAEQHVPPYAKPVGKLACDSFKLARNTACNVFGAGRELISAKLPVAAQFLEQYVPGLPKKIENTSSALTKVAIDVYGKTLSFVKTQVLVGRLSPESLSKALNETRNAAQDYYNIFHKKVDAYAKLK